MQAEQVHITQSMKRICRIAYSRIRANKPFVNKDSLQIRSRCRVHLVVSEEVKESKCNSACKFAKNRFFVIYVQGGLIFGAILCFSFREISFTFSILVLHGISKLYF